MNLIWLKRMIAVTTFTLAAVAVAWLNREALDYLDGGVKFACIAAIPALFLLGYFLWERTHPNSDIRWKKGLESGYTVVIFLATLWLMRSAIFIPVDAWMTPVHNVRKYEFVLGRRHTSFTAHFPHPIPAGVRDVCFYYIPGALQGATVLEIGYTTTPEQIDTLYHEYKRRSALTFTAGTENGYIEPINCLANDTRDFADFSEDYTLFYLDEHPPTDAKDWNHPHSHGVAISRKRCRVVFWAWGG